jgi:hypothetical protein
MLERPSRREIALLTVVLLVGLGLRVSGLAHDLPYIEHPDEAVYFGMSQELVREGKLWPHILNIPSLLFDVTALAQIPYYLVAKLTGTLGSRADVVGPTILAMGVSKTSLPGALLWCRCVMVAVSLGTVVATYALARLVTRRSAAGLLAALFTAVSPVHVALSRTLTPDTLAVFFVTLSALLLARVLVRGERRDYLRAGVAIGLAASAKYNAGFVVVLLPLAHYLRLGTLGRPSRTLVLSLLAIGASFVLTSPITIIAFPRFLRTLGVEGHHYASTHSGMEGGATGWYLREMGRTSGAVYVLAVAEMVRGIRARSKPLCFIAAFPLLYFVFIASFAVRNDRTYLPLTTCMFTLAASLVTWLFERRSELGAAHWPAVIVGGALAAAGVAQPLVVSRAETRALVAPNGRATGREWIAAHVPQGSKIAIESYAPFVDPARFEVTGFDRVIAHDPAWYRANGFRYVVLSSLMYGRFLALPERFPEDVARYRDFLERLPLVRSFPEGSCEVRVYALDEGARAAIL